MEAMTNNTFVPMIRSAGANSVQMIRTGDMTFCVVTQYDDEAAASAAQAKIADVRSKAVSDLPMTMDSAYGGPVFAAS